MGDAPTTLAKLACEERTARGIAGYLGESLDPETVACSAFETADGTWEVSIHFRERPDEDAVRALVRLAAGEDAARALAFEEVASKDWVKSSLEGLTPVPAGRFVVHGAHDRTRVPDNRIGIEIEAALAFGTGHHGTTRGCLLALDGLNKRWRARRLLDLGTGSGVLAIAAAKSTTARIAATDIDPLAVNVARANARLNRTGPRIAFIRAHGCQGREVTARAPYDLVLANILLGPLTRMAAALTRLTAPNARVVLSGLLPSQANAVLAIYRAQGLKLERRIPLDGWMTLVLKRGR